MNSEPTISLHTDDLSVPIKDAIRLLTYNVFLRPPLVHNNEDDYKNERCEYIIDALKNYDIVCLQELFGLLNQRKQRLTQKAIKLGLTYQAVSPTPSFFSGQVVDGGLVTLSRYPILHQQFQQFPYGILSDNLAFKGFLYTKIDVQGCILHLFNAHLQASYIGNDSNVRATVNTRIDQLIAYRKYLLLVLSEQQYSKQDLVLLVGDYNIDSFHEGFPTTMVPPTIADMLNRPQRYKEYDGLMALLSGNGKDKLINTVYDKQMSHQVTYADYEDLESGDKKPLETCLTTREDLCSGQCLDYIMQMILEGDVADTQLQIIDAQVEKFLVEGEKFTQLSDHYGVKCDIHINNQQK